MEIHPYKPLHWTLKLTFEERQVIFRNAAKLRVRPSVYLREIIENALEIEKKYCK